MKTLTLHNAAGQEFHLTWFDQGHYRFGYLSGSVEEIATQLQHTFLSPVFYPSGERVFPENGKSSIKTDS